MQMELEDEDHVCVETRVKPGVTVVPHNTRADGAWRDRETGQLVPPPEQGQTYLVDLNVSSGGNVLIAYPTQQWYLEGRQAGVV